MNKTIIVYGATIKRAFAKMEEILDDLKYSEVKQVRRSSNKFVIDLYNGDRYLTATGHENSRGLRWQFAYIDNDIDIEIVDNVILPSFRVVDKEGRINYDCIANYCEWF